MNLKWNENICNGVRHLPLNFCALTFKIVVSFCMDSLAFFSNWVFAEFTNLISVFWEQHVGDCSNGQYRVETPKNSTNRNSEISVRIRNKYNYYYYYRKLKKNLLEDIKKSPIRSYFISKAVFTRNWENDENIFWQSLFYALFYAFFCSSQLIPIYSQFH